MNRYECIGRLTKDIEVRYTEGSQTAFTRFSVALDRRKKDGTKKTEYIPCQAWGKTAELLNDYCKKDDRVGIAGSITTGSYERDGHKVFTTEVLVDEVEFLEPKEKKEEEPKIPEGFAQITDEDIPF